jgi:NAD(P)-dependent dehydrogenase (short-subunit alcohol dehydrogenase family)
MPHRQASASLKTGAMCLKREQKMNDTFAGKVAIVTGAANGIGRATASMLAAEGCRVAYVDIDKAEEAAKSDGQPLSSGFPCDVSDSNAVAIMVRAVVERYGRIDILANVAGIFPYSALLDTSDDLLHKVMAVNFFGVAYTARSAVPFMRNTGGGVIVNVASGAGVRPIAGLSAYGASKGAVIAFSRSLALELAPEIRVNVVSPGPTRTANATAISGDKTIGSALDRTSPLGRAAQAEEVADAICYLASDRARFITGQNLHVNGGRFMP